MLNAPERRLEILLISDSEGRNPLKGIERRRTAPKNCRVVPAKLRCWKKGALQSANLKRFLPSIQRRRQGCKPWKAKQVHSDSYGPSSTYYRTNDITVRGAVKIASNPTCSSNGYYHTDNKGGAQQLVPIQFPPSRRFLNFNVVFKIQPFLGWKSAIFWGVDLANLWPISSELWGNSKNASMAGIVLG